MKLAVVGTSKKEHEKRVPIHPDHIAIIPQRIRTNLYFEKGYGLAFGMSDERIRDLTGNEPRDRSVLLREFEAVIITKPVKEDLLELSKGTLLWGWVHCVQQSDITQIAINKRLTLIAWENMYYQGKRDRIHIFNKNNEIAGYCSVQHALELRGIDGNFGPARKVMVLSLGSVSRGAVYALKGHGFGDISIYTQRPSFLAGNRIPGLRYKQIVEDDAGAMKAVNYRKEKRTLLEEMTEADIIVNGVLQDPNNPMVFIEDEDIARFKKECLIIDVSCDTGMGFSFAHPTSFENPITKIGNITYYAVDHTPALLWDSASWEISRCVLHYLHFLVDGTPSKVLREATDIQKGEILNKDIITYQRRCSEYPYSPLEGDL